MAPSCALSTRWTLIDSGGKNCSQPPPYALTGTDRLHHHGTSDMAAVADEEGIAVAFITAPRETAGISAPQEGLDRNLPALRICLSHDSDASEDKSYRAASPFRDHVGAGEHPQVAELCGIRSDAVETTKHEAHVVEMSRGAVDCLGANRRRHLA